MSETGKHRPRELPRRDYERLRTATADLLVDGGGSARRAAEHTRVSHQQLGNYVSDRPEHDETFMPIDIVADLEAEAVSRGRRALVTETLAELSGHRLVRIDAAGLPGRDEAALLKSAKETTEALSDAWAAIADGRKTREECRQVTRQFDEAISALLEARELFLGGL